MRFFYADLTRNFLYVIFIISILPASIVFADEDFSCTDSDATFWKFQEDEQNLQLFKDDVYTLPVCYEKNCQIRVNQCMDYETLNTTLSTTTHGLMGVQDSNLVLCCSQQQEYIPLSSDEFTYNDNDSVGWFVPYGNYTIDLEQSVIQEQTLAPFFINATITCLNGDCGNTFTSLSYVDNANDVLYTPNLQLEYPLLVSFISNPLFTFSSFSVSESTRELFDIEYQQDNCLSNMNPITNQQCNVSWIVYANFQQNKSFDLQIVACSDEYQIECDVSELIRVNITADFVCEDWEIWNGTHCVDDVVIQEYFCGTAHNQTFTVANTSFGLNTACSDDNEPIDDGFVYPQPNITTEWFCPGGDEREIMCYASRQPCDDGYTWNNTHCVSSPDDPTELFCGSEHNTTYSTEIMSFTSNNFCAQEPQPSNVQFPINPGNNTVWTCGTNRDLHVVSCFALKEECPDDQPNWNGTACVSDEAYYCGTAHDLEFPLIMSDFSDYTYCSDNAIDEDLAIELPQPGQTTSWSCEGGEDTSVLCQASRESCSSGYSWNGTHCESDAPQTIELHRSCAEVEFRDWVSHFYQKEHETQVSAHALNNLESVRDQSNGNLLPDVNGVEVTRIVALLQDERIKNNQAYACVTNQLDTCTAEIGFTGCAYKGKCYENNTRIKLDENQQVTQNATDLEEYDLVCVVNSPGEWYLPPPSPSNECTDDSHVMCSEDNGEYFNRITYQKDETTNTFCVNQSGSYNWLYSEDGLDDIQNIVSNQCGNGIDNHCTAHLYFAKFDNGSVDYSKYRYGEKVFNVETKPDAFDPICYDNTNLKGDVQNTAGASLEDVEVKLYIVGPNTEYQLFKTTYTDSSGQFNFSKIPRTSYRLIFQKGGYHNEVRFQNIDDNQEEDIETITLTTGDCRADCTTGAQPSICSANCDGFGGCNFNSSQVATALDGIATGISHTITLSGTNYVVDTCTGDPVEQATLTSSGQITCPSGQELIIIQRIALLDGDTVRIKIPICRSQ